jgi:hypothetical protein
VAASLARCVWMVNAHAPRGSPPTVARAEARMPSCKTVQLEQRLMEAFADAVSLRRFHLGGCVIDVVNREIEFMLVTIMSVAIRYTAIGEHEIDVNVVFGKVRDDAIVHLERF